MKRLGILGWPVAHSRSPLIHRHWIAAHGLDADYVPCPVPPDADMAATLEKLRMEGFVGLNITIPHKEKVFAQLTQLRPAAKRLAAVNTLALENEVWVGDNTDAAGFADALAAHTGIRRALVLGAGGAARAVVGALIDGGVESVCIANRTRARAEALAADVEQAHVCDWESRNTALADCDALINATSLGMDGAPPLDIALDALAAESVVVDLVYAPLETALLAEARARGLAAVDGLGMLLHQAARAFEIWFGVRPSVDADLDALLRADLA